MAYRYELDTERRREEKNSRIKQIVLAISLSKVTLAKSERSISRSCKSFSICASFSLTKRYGKQIIHRINSEVMTSHNISVKKQKNIEKVNGLHKLTEAI